MRRIEIQNIRPRTPTGHPAKGAIGEVVPVSADIFREGHWQMGARARWRAAGEKGWHDAHLELLHNDIYQGEIIPEAVGPLELAIEAWTDRFGTWRHHLEAHAAADTPDVPVELLVGADLLEELAPRAEKADRPRLLEAAATLRSDTCTLRTKLDTALDPLLVTLLERVPDPYDLTRAETAGLWVDRPLGRFSAWYELFPRSEGGFVGATKRLGAVAAMGFDIVYLPPIHPIGTTNRKGAGGTLVPASTDPGSPWAIGGAEGGHDAIAPELGTLVDFAAFREETERLGMEVALDYALQCSPDHPWVGEHPEWFRARPDGTLRYAENPPKKYQDIHPIEFWPEHEDDRVALWNACRDILEYWIGHGVKVFRVDNPHTKPFAFWEWVIADVRSRHPEVLFLAEAFTRPKIMATLAAVGFTQGYTYFTWRTAGWELRQYIDELAHSDLVDFYRPNFWPNTPDILSGPLRDGLPSAFRIRAVLAALLVPNWGLYSGYELFENEPASEANEEYRASEKYEVKQRDWNAEVTLAPFLTKLNAIRKAHPSFAELRTTTVHGSTNDDSLVVWSKTTPDGGDPMLMVVNLDPRDAREGLLHLDLDAVGMPPTGPYEAYDELTGETFVWDGPNPYVRLDPLEGRECHVLRLRTV